MAARTSTEGEHPGGDLLGTLGLLLNIGGVIFAAVWLSMISGGYPGGSHAVAGGATVVSLAASFACFARR